MRLFIILTFLFNLLSTITFASSVNDTTSRQLRTKYLCKVATKDFQKPYLNEMDAFRIDKANFGYVDLYGDGSIELIAGFSDEAFRSDNGCLKMEINKEVLVIVNICYLARKAQLKSLWILIFGWPGI